MVSRQSAPGISLSPGGANLPLYLPFYLFFFVAIFSLSGDVTKRTCWHCLPIIRFQYVQLALTDSDLTLMMNILGTAICC